jgi:hypothetical protein
LLVNGAAKRFQPVAVLLFGEELVGPLKLRERNLVDFVDGDVGRELRRRIELGKRGKRDQQGGDDGQSRHRA